MPRVFLKVRLLLLEIGEESGDEHDGKQNDPEVQVFDLLLQRVANEAEHRAGQKEERKETCECLQEAQPLRNGLRGRHAIRTIPLETNGLLLRGEALVAVRFQSLSQEDR